jgi:TatD DNase family protein
MRLLNTRGGRGSFTGTVTYKNAAKSRAAALEQGVERLMVETDCPYLAPEPLRGKVCEPAFVAHTLAALARLFSVPEADLPGRPRATRSGFSPPRHFSPKMQPCVFRYSRDSPQFRV